MVRPARRMLRAISLGVFWRLAPSTMAIIRSRKVSPGSVVTRTISQSESTLRPARDRAAVAAALADDRRALTGDGALVHGRRSCDHLAVGGDQLARFHQDDVAPPQQAGGHLLRAGVASPARSSLRASTSWRALRSVSAWASSPALGQGLGEVGEDDGEPQQGARWPG